MLKRIDKSKAWIAFLLVALLIIPLIGWNALPKSLSSGVPGDIPATGSATLQSTFDQKSPANSVERGQNLFMGKLPFRNGGPPCMGCHNVGSNGLLGGGALGSDLTNVATKRSPQEIASILSNRGPTMSPVMQPIFAEHPLTESEQADLIAFLDASVGQPESNKEILVIGISLAGSVAAAFALGFVYRNRLRGVRKALLRKAL